MHVLCICIDQVFVHRDSQGKASAERVALGRHWTTLRGEANYAPRVVGFSWTLTARACGEKQGWTFWCRYRYLMLLWNAEPTWTNWSFLRQSFLCFNHHEVFAALPPKKLWTLSASMPSFAILEGVSRNGLWLIDLSIIIYYYHYYYQFIIFQFLDSLLPAHLFVISLASRATLDDFGYFSHLFSSFLIAREDTPAVSEFRFRWVKFWVQAVV